MKTSKFFLSTLIAASAMSANAYADTTVGSGDSALTYAGNIYTFAGWNSADFHNGGWIRNTVDENGNIVNSEFGGVENWEAGSSNTFPSISSMFGNVQEPSTLRFAQAEDITIGDATQHVTARSVSVSFDSLNLGGLIVEEGATGNSIVQNSVNRKFYFRTGTDTPFVGTINEDFQVKAVTGLYFHGAQNWTVGSGKTLSLISNRIDFSEATNLRVNGGTIAVSSSSVVFGGLEATSSTFNEAVGGFQENVQETYTLYSGTGTISGLTTENVTVNGRTMSSISGNTATRNLSVYNILAGSEVNYTDADVSTADRINVLGTLNCGLVGWLEGGADKYALIEHDDIVGSGTIKMESQTTGHGASVSLSEDFTGTVEFTGKLNTWDTSLSKDATLKLYNYDTTTSSLWGGGTLASKVVFATDYQIGDSTPTTIGFSGDVTGEEGTTVTITGNATANFNGATTFDTLNASGTIGLGGATSVSTMNVATGETLNLNGVHNLTATSVVLNEGATLTLGNLSDGQNVNLSGLTGTGTISVSKTSGNHNHTVDLGTVFAGTVELKGYFNSSALTLGSATDGTVKLNGVWFWGGHPTFTKKVEFVNTDDVIVGSGTSGKNYSSNGMTFNKGATFKEGAKFQIAGTTTNWGTLELEANSKLTVGDLKVSAWSSSNQTNKTLKLDDGAAVTVSSKMVNDSGLAVENAGLIKAGTITYATASGWDRNTFSGTGAVVADRFNVENTTQFVFQNHTFVIGGLTFESIVSGYQNGDVRFGNATIGATKDWSSSKSIALTGVNGTEATTTTFNTGTFDEVIKTFSSETGHTITLGGELSGNGGIKKAGAGALTLSGTNSYSGGTTIEAGTLIAGSNSALGTNFVKISGGKLEVSSGVTVSNNITVVLGDTLDAAVITGDGSLGGKITLDYAASAENVALALATEETTKTYTLLSGNVGSSLSMDFFELGTGWADGWKISDYVYNSETGVGTLTLGIPEPSAFGLLAGVGALALVASRRRCSRR